jgi:quercetin dioxygenase-like cupin family protein
MAISIQVDSNISGFFRTIGTKPIPKLLTAKSLHLMTTTRIFNSAKFFQPIDGEPIRSVITESEDAVIVAWYIQPQQEIPAHQHPSGQDTWTILAGKGEYYLDKTGLTTSISAGDVVIAPMGSVHGVFNHSNEPLIFISVVSPAIAGYELITDFERIDVSAVTSASL